MYVSVVLCLDLACLEYMTKWPNPDWSQCPREHADCWTWPLLKSTNIWPRFTCSPVARAIPDISSATSHDAHLWLAPVSTNCDNIQTEPKCDSQATGVGSRSLIRSSLNSEQAENQTKKKPNEGINRAGRNKNRVGSNTRNYHRNHTETDLEPYLLTVLTHRSVREECVRTFCSVQLS